MPGPRAAGVTSPTCYLLEGGGLFIEKGCTFSTADVLFAFLLTVFILPQVHGVRTGFK